jgi:hypothetical protein
MKQYRVTKKYKILLKLIKMVAYVFNNTVLGISLLGAPKFAE